MIVDFFAYIHIYIVDYNKPFKMPLWKLTTENNKSFETFESKKKISHECLHCKFLLNICPRKSNLRHGFIFSIPDMMWIQLSPWYLFTMY